VQVADYGGWRNAWVVPPRERPALGARLVVRPAMDVDGEGVVRMLEAAFAPLAALYTPAAYVATVPGAEEIQARLREPETGCWVALVDGRMAGTVTATRRPDGVYVRSMAVVPAARGNGVGRRLLDEVVRFAEASGARRLSLSTTPFLEAAIRLYAACGFTVVPGEGPSDLHGTPLLTMERVLKPRRRPLAGP
jgi:GNAT superfamily N-acetyltransferase